MRFASKISSPSIKQVLYATLPGMNLPEGNQQLEKVYIEYALPALSVQILCS